LEDLLILIIQKIFEEFIKINAYEKCAKVVGKTAKIAAEIILINKDE